MTRHLDGLNVLRWIQKIADEKKRNNRRLSEKEILELAQDKDRHDNSTTNQEVDEDEESGRV